MHDSSYCFQRVLAIAILSICMSVCPSITRVDQSKTVKARITRSSVSSVGCLEDSSFNTKGGHPKWH